jgi:glycosyltransferase involved in cell wall biosynthesis
MARDTLDILLLHRYFWPDAPPYGHMLKAIAERLAADGHRVTVLSTQPCYKKATCGLRRPPREICNGVAIRRVSIPCEEGCGKWMRIINLIRYLLAVFAHGIRHRSYDVVMTSTMPPVFAGVAGRLAALPSRAKLIYNCMDIYPELGQLSGDFNSGWVFKLLMSIEKRTCRASDHIVVLSEDMQDAVNKRDTCLADRISIINNFSLSDDIPSQSTSDDLLPPSDCFRIVFAGNIGRFQGLENMIEAMRLLDSDANIELVLMGEGRAKATLQEEVTSLGLDHVLFLPHQSVERAAKVVSTCHAGFISLQPNVYRFAYPSKTMFYLQQGIPILANVEPHSALSKMIEREDVGVVAGSSQPADLAAAIVHARERFMKEPRVADNARSAASRLFGREVTLNRWAMLFNGMAM